MALNIQCENKHELKCELLNRNKQRRVFWICLQPFLDVRLRWSSFSNSVKFYSQINSNQTDYKLLTAQENVSYNKKKCILKGTTAGACMRQTFSVSTHSSWCQCDRGDKTKAEQSCMCQVHTSMWERKIKSRNYLNTCKHTHTWVHRHMQPLPLFPIYASQTLLLPHPGFSTWN